MTRTVWVLRSVAGANEPTPQVLGVYSTADRAMDAASVYLAARHPTFPWPIHWTEGDPQVYEGRDTGPDHTTFLVAAATLDGKAG